MTSNEGLENIVKENGSQILKKLTFIDTPGLGKNCQHSEPTISALQSCDAVIWFVKGPDSISKDDIKFIQDNIGKRTLYVVISFIDECNNPDSSINIIKKTFMARIQLFAMTQFHFCPGYSLSRKRGDS